ncbi:hypothetical protein [Spirosoma sp. KUDC1026]|uniref:hypothetical protein n=1 Tax=Spirosoma sp. KUDC1026 TaxID=2745947 RepID=UPI00159B8CF5|nr:hypothetical protein [Spirosoma sp. KUDC1026]QKZ11196.1 hypothetical protein HU175_00485 [Spirosoma sp. KUDC1026]
MRSQFLTILCILSFIGCAISLADATISLTNTQAAAETTYVKPNDTPEERKDKPNQYFEDRSSGDQPMPGDTDEIRSLAIAQLIYALLTLTGAILMFNLRRIGFWIYVAGVVVGTVLPVSLAGFGAINTSFGVVFSFVFVALYWLNIKDMH